MSTPIKSITRNTATCTLYRP